MVNPAPGFLPICGPLGPTAGPGSPGNGPGSKKSAGSTKHQPPRPSVSPIRGHVAFLGVDRRKITRSIINLRPPKVCPENGG